MIFDDIFQNLFNHFLFKFSFFLPFFKPFFFSHTCRSLLSIQLSIEAFDFEMEEQDSRSFLQAGQWAQGNSDTPRRDPPSRSHDSTVTQASPIALAHLHLAKERFLSFVEEIGPLADTPIREDVLAYCGAQRKSERCLDGSLRPECLLRKIDVRIEKMIKTKKIKRNWGEQDLRILIWIVSKYSDHHSLTDLQKDITAEDWQAIASLIPGVTAQGCMFKWLSIKKITLATHGWSKEESQLLGKIVQARGGAGEQGAEWKQVSQELYRLSGKGRVFRNAKQCREHWACYLSPQLKKGPWQLDEDVKLLRFIRDNKGLKRWSEIAKHFSGRTENALKNRYTLLVQKQKRIPKNKNKTQLAIISEYLEKCYVDQFTVNVKMEEERGEEDHEQQESIYREESSINRQRASVNVKREEIIQEDTDQFPAITPLKVQKFSITDFEAMNTTFFKNIQPGVIKSDGTFRKIPNINSSSLESDPPTKIEDGGKDEPFLLLQLHG